MKRLAVSPFSSQSSLSRSQKDFWLSWNISLFKIAVVGYVGLDLACI